MLLQAPLPFRVRLATVAAGISEFSVTIASGTVGEDLTAFPVMVDLQDMPAAFWSNVRSDGGNIRAYSTKRTAQHWRLKGTLAGSFNGGALGEIEFYAALGGTSIATGGTPSAGSAAFGGTAAAAFDGNKVSGIWAGASGAISAGTSWVAYDFGSPVSITSFELTGRNSSDANQMWDGWDLEYSEDNVTWVTLESYSDATAWTAGESRTYEVTAGALDLETMIPHDVTSINVADKRGRMYIKSTVRTASDTVLSVKLLASDVTELADDNANGMNAVWADYTVVAVFPETINRVNSAAANTVGASVETSKWKETYAQDINVNQGAAFDGTHYYGVSTNALTKVALNGTVVASNADPVGDVNTAQSIANLNHAGAPDIIDGELWVPVEEYTNSPYDTQFIARYSLADLTLIGSLQLTGATREASGFYYDTALARLYVTDFTVDGSIPYYNKSTGAYIGALTLSTNITDMQGITRVGDFYYVSSDTNGVYEVALDGTVTAGGVILEELYTGSFESVFNYLGNLYVTKDTGFVRTFSDNTVDYDWMRIHGTPMLYDTPTGTVWTIGTSWLATPTITQQGIIGVFNTADVNDRHSLMFDAGPNRIDAWNPSDSWFAPNPDVNPVAYDVLRVALSQDGTTARALYVDGALNDTDTGSSARPTAGTSMTVAIGGGAGTEYGFGSYQFGWLREEVMPANWLAADGANMLDPSTFYTIGDTGAPAQPTITNGGFETGTLSGWTVASGNVVVSDGSEYSDNANSARTGTSMIFQNVTAGGVLEQVIDVSDWATEIDAGVATFTLEAYLITDVADAGRLTLQPLTDADADIGVGTTGAYTVNNSTSWLKLTVSMILPANTRKVTIGLDGNKSGAGSVCQAYFDDAAITMSRP
jgi:hypothetical protein